MPLYFEVDAKTYHYVLDAAPLADIAGLDESGLLRRVIEISSKVREHYELNIAKYGKLIGQGRIGLLELFDDLFIGVILVHDAIKQKTRESFSVFQKSLSFKVLVENRINKYSSSGLIDEKDARLPNNFGVLYHELILKNLKKLLLAYKEGVNPEATDEKRHELYTLVDSLLYSFIVIRHSLLNCYIDR